MLLALRPYLHRAPQAVQVNRPLVNEYKAALQQISDATEIGDQRTVSESYDVLADLWEVADEDDRLAMRHASEQWRARNE